MKYFQLLIIVTVLFTSSTLAQNITKDNDNFSKNYSFGGISIGYDSKLHLLLDISYFDKSGISGKFCVGLKLPNGTEGKAYNTINWDQFPEDIIKEGSYYNTYDFGLGYYFYDFYVFGIVGFANKNLYRNNFDKFHILGDNGKYYLTLDQGFYLNYGCEVGYKVKKFLISIVYSKYGEIGLKCGISLGN